MMAKQERTLLIDLGNSSLKWAWLEAGRLSSIERAPYSDGDGGANLPAEQWREQGKPDRVLISAVAAATVVETVRNWLFEHWDLEPEMLKAEARALGVTSGYDNPGQLGVDRWIALIAAHHSVAGPACIVDCGTAVTIDVIARDGRHQGGLILPGIGLMREALRRETAIPWDENESGAVDQLLAADTGSAIAAGGVNAVAALVEKVLEQSAEKLGERPMLLLTGGDSERLQSVLREPATREPDLVMKGMALVADAH
jgi:type III pantothenate kinase